MLQVAVVGLGWWGRTILGLLEGSRKLKVVRAVDVQAPPPPGMPFSRTLEEALQDAQVQGVILCTPHSLHAGQIVQAAQARRHVFCEKPLSLTRADAMRAVRACNDQGVTLAVGHEKRFEPPIRQVFALARSGALGSLLQIEANFSQNKLTGLPPDNWRVSNRDAPAGPMTATGIHLLDLAVGLMGPATQVLARVAQLGSPLANGDTLGLLATHANGGHCLISAILATPFDGRFAVYGSEGWVEVRDKAHPESPQGWVFTKVSRSGYREVTEYPPSAPVLANLEAFAEAAGGGAPYPVPQEEMIANIAALEAVIRSAASGRVEEVAN